MIRKSAYWLLAVLVAVLAACAPRTAPSSSSTPPTPLSTPALQEKPILPGAAEEAWTKVIERAKQEGQVTFYTVNLIGDIGSALSQSFANRYGIKVEYVTGIGATLLERVKSEYAAQKSIADLYDTASSWALVAMKEGLLQKVGDLPVLAEKDVWRVPIRYDSEGYIVVFGVSYTGPLINTNLVKPGNEPRSYKDLLAPQWKGKLIVGTPATDPRTIWLYVIGKKEGFLDEDYFRRLAKQDLKIVPSLREVDSLLSRGEAYVAPTGIGTAAAAMVREGAPLRLLTPEEGTLVMGAPPVAL